MWPQRRYLANNTTRCAEVPNLRVWFTLGMFGDARWFNHPFTKFRISVLQEIG